MMMARPRMKTSRALPPSRRPDPERLQSLSDPTPGVALASSGVILHPSGPESGPGGQSQGPDNEASPQLTAPYRQFRRVGRVGLEPRPADYEKYGFVHRTR
jgi:hypothetical protein